MLSGQTYVDILRPQQKNWGLVYDGVTILCASVVLALSAQVAFYIPASPVPVTLQSLAVLLLGALLGNKRALAATSLYVFEGAVGLPVFAAGQSGFVYILGPSGGYLFGFIAAASIVGWLAENDWDRQVYTTIFAMLIGLLALYACGVAWLSSYVGLQAALHVGVLPFALLDVVKVILASLILPFGWKLISSIENTF